MKEMNINFHNKDQENILTQLCEVYYDNSDQNGVLDKVYTIESRRRAGKTWALCIFAGFFLKDRLPVTIITRAKRSEKLINDILIQLGVTKEEIMNCKVVSVSSALDISRDNTTILIDEKHSLDAIQHSDNKELRKYLFGQYNIPHGICVTSPEK